MSELVSLKGESGSYFLFFGSVFVFGCLQMASKGSVCGESKSYENAKEDDSQPCLLFCNHFRSNDYKADIKPEIGKDGENGSGGEYTSIKDFLRGIYGNNGDSTDNQEVKSSRSNNSGSTEWSSWLSKCSKSFNDRQEDFRS